MKPLRAVSAAFRMHQKWSYYQLSQKLLEATPYFQGWFNFSMNITKFNEFHCNSIKNVFTISFINYTQNIVYYFHGEDNLY